MKGIKEITAGLKALDSDVTRLGHITALLEWDQETYMPEAAAEERAAQIALLSGLHHEKVVDPAWNVLLQESAGIDPKELDETDAAYLREVRRRWDRQVKVPKKLVEEMARQTSLSQTAWVGARKNNDFGAFAPYLERMIELENEWAAIVSPDEDAYDVLLDEYEPGAGGDEIAVVFDNLASGLKKILLKINSGKAPDTAFLEKSYDVDRQDAFGRKIQSWMGYDTRRGRLDLSAHPFTTTLGPDDVRVTTRYDSELVLSGLFSNIHEAGHGLYEQGFGSHLQGTVLADGTSLGIHESQSRFWENTLGRSRSFWEKWYPKFQALFPENLTGIDAETFYRAANLVQPSLIRVEADEVTYSFHVIIRFRLERALVSGELKVADLPAAWNEAYADLLGIEVPTDADGCLQDVHWAAGLFGYFPTYALGNLYAAQFTRKLEQDLGSLADLAGGDDAKPILGWLRENIHIQGRVLPPGDLCRRVTGSDLDSAHFLEYLDAKYGDIYGY